MKEPVSQKRSPVFWIVLGLAALVILAAAGSAVGMKLMYDSNFERIEQRKYHGYLRYVDVSESYPRSPVQFTSGENRLRGYLYGEQNDKGLVIFSHGQGFVAEDYLPEALYFVDQGWRVLLFDNTGTGESEGANTVGLAQSALDLNAALAFVESEPGLRELPVMLYGHSWGGYAVAAVLNEQHANVRAAVSVSGYASPVELLKEQVRAQTGPLAALEIPFGLAYQRRLFGAAAEVSAVEGINRSGLPVMVLHGAQDEAIAYDGAAIIAHQAQITNPNVIYITRAEPGRDGHNTLLMSAAAKEYVDQKNAEFQALLEQHGNPLPDEARDTYYAGVDRWQTSELDAEIMAQMNAFYEAALAQ